ncbi:hypothetical protein RND81_11G072900 [Saponaria officinalis]|uniref:DUF7798 domain-containing protein n=1 Tax=Saponaria officinalis TaxID=3572 RepID=A0AAW1HJ68_SAPOF
MEEQSSNTNSINAKNEPITSPDVDATGGGSGGGWGGWGFSPLSYLSDLQKAAEEISRNAVAVAQTAAKSIADIDNVAEDSESSKEEDGVDDSATKGKDGHEEEKMKFALDKLEKASEDTFLSQGLKVFDNSVENFASGAWKALGSALKGGSDIIQKLEHSAANIAESVQQGGTTGPIAPSLLETGKAFTFKGIQALENVGKETMDLLLSESGIDVDKNSDGADHQGNEDQLYEETTFDRCFYIYGGPEQLEELEALASHYTLLFNRRKAKLSSEQKSFYDGLVKQVHLILDLNAETHEIDTVSDKGKKTEIGGEGGDDELKSLHELSVGKAADMAAGFTSALAGLAANDIIQRTAGRLDSLHSEGVHRLSEICCFAVSQLFLFGKSITSTASKSQGDDADDEMIKIKWPEDSLEKAKIIRLKAQSMSESMEAVSNSFITGISEVSEAYLAAVKSLTADTPEAPLQKSIQEKASAYAGHLRTAQSTAIGKIQDGLQFLCFVVLSTAMPSA